MCNGPYYPTDYYQNSASFFNFWSSSFNINIPSLSTLNPSSTTTLHRLCALAHLYEFYASCSLQWFYDWTKSEPDIFKTIYYHIYRQYYHTDLSQQNYVMRAMFLVRAQSTWYGRYYCIPFLCLRTFLFPFGQKMFAQLKF